MRALPIPQKSDKPNEVQYTEKQVRGRSLVLYVSYGGKKTWRVLYYAKNEKGKLAPRSKALGTFPELTVTKARDAAKTFDAPKAAASSATGTFHKVAEEWVERYVRGKALRSEREIIRQLNRYVYPVIGSTPLFEVNRKKVNELLNTIEDGSGAAQANPVLATVRKMMR